jgi:hypothetical protein
MPRHANKRFPDLPVREAVAAAERRGETRVGSALIWDFRMLDSGRANHDVTPRPILVPVHSRNWWMGTKRNWALRYRNLQIAWAVHDYFDKPLRSSPCAPT